MLRGISGTGSNLSENKLKIDKESRNNNKSFNEMLKNSLSQVNDLQQESDKITRDFSLGKTDNVHKVTVASEKASIALNLTTAVQNKIVDGYKEIMRMQV
ncbi:MAG: flagellar hook-basal body complex protein FliE [Halanaerobiales bacterium]